MIEQNTKLQFCLIKQTKNLKDPQKLLFKLGLNGRSFLGSDKQGQGRCVLCNRPSVVAFPLAFYLLDHILSPISNNPQDSGHYRHHFCMLKILLSLQCVICEYHTILRLIDVQ